MAGLHEKAIAVLQKRKQQEQPQQQEPLLQAPTYKIDPNLLQQQ